MSRHQAYRNLNVYTELEDYDYRDEDDYEDEQHDNHRDRLDHMTESDRIQMAVSYEQVMELIGDIPGCTRRDIENCLWRYYYDVPKTVDHVLKTYTLPAVPQAETDCNNREILNKGPSDPYGPQFQEQNSGRTLSVPSLFSPKLDRNTVLSEFWDDSPWGKIPSSRRADILVESVFPTGGLLGGSGGGRSSKLAALMKAKKGVLRDNKEPQEAGPPAGKVENRAVSLLSKLSDRGLISPTSSTSCTRTQISGQPLNSVARPLPASEISTGGSSFDATQPSPSFRSLTHEVPKHEAPATISDLIRPTLPELKGRRSQLLTLDQNASSVLVKRTPPSSFALSMFGGGLIKPIMKNSADSILFYGSAAAHSPQTALNNAFVTPSPDDIILTAQGRVNGFSQNKVKPKQSLRSKPHETSKRSSSNTGPQQPNGGITSDLERIIKTRKNLDVVEEFKKVHRKENASFVVIGHVDAGKSTLMGRLLYDLGVVNERTMKKYRNEADKIGKSSFALAWVMDQTDEERCHGVTIDVAYSKFEAGNCVYTILDAPGHKDFIPNMIAGASQADFALLVVDATPGEFETGFSLRGQTKEHTFLVRSLGVQRIIVAVNKFDNVHWSLDRFEEIRTQIGRFLTTAGFHPKNVGVVPCSGLTGDNVTKKPKEGLIPWYNNGTLIEELVRRTEKPKSTKQAIEKPFRLTIANIYRGGIISPVSVSGRIQCGSVQIGDVLLNMPIGQKAAVRAIDVDEEPQDWAVAGYNVVLHLGGIELDHLRHGDVLCDLNNPIPTMSVFSLKILAFETITPMMVDIHRGRLCMAGRVAKLKAIYDKNTGIVGKKKPRHVPAGSLASIQVEVRGAGPGNGTIPVELGTKIVLRAFGQTVAAGLVEQFESK